MRIDYLATISEHIKHIFEEGELEEEVVVRNFRTTTQHGAIEDKTQTREVKYYNLDVIISVGFLLSNSYRLQKLLQRRSNGYNKKSFQEMRLS